MCNICDSHKQWTMFMNVIFLLICLESLRNVEAFPSYTLLSDATHLENIVVRHTAKHTVLKRSLTARTLPEIHTTISRRFNDDVDTDIDTTRENFNKADGVHDKYNDFTTYGDDIKLTFIPTRDQRLSSAFPDLRRLSKRGNSSQECSVFYADPKNFAHAVVDRCSNPEQIKMLAEIVYKERVYLIVPVEPTMGGDIHHRLYPLDTPIDYHGDFDESAVKNIPSKPSASPQLRNKRAAGLNVVEIVYIIDYSLYKHWYDRTNGTALERETQTLNNLRTYFAFFTRAMSYRYQGLKDRTSNAIDLSVELVDIVYLKTPSESAMTEVATTTDTRGLVEAPILLQNFTSWLKDKKATSGGTIPTGDHYMLLTYRDLFVDQNLQAAGYANVGTICEEEATSVVEWSFHGLSATTGTHELAHSLGGLHDGDNNACNSQDRYILAVANLPGTDDKARHPWMFSDCSAHYLNTMIDSLNNNQNNCLTVNNAVQRVPISGPMLGQLYNPDDQCRQAFGSQAELARAGHENGWTTFCTGMACVTDSIEKVILQLPLIGTTCGDKKWCQNGECVSSSEAPSANPACLFGDQPHEYESGRTCDVVKDSLSNCYIPRILNACCKSCLDKKTNISDCEYGDRYKCSGIKNQDCYSNTTRNYCCKSCHEFVNPLLPPDCMYGDKKLGCTTANCHLYPDDCCGTCAGFTKTPFNPTTKKNIQPTQPVTSEPSSSTRQPKTTTHPTVTTNKPPAPSEQKGLDDWVIPVAAGAGGVVALGLIGLLLTCCCRRQSSTPRQRRSHSSGRDSRQQYGRQGSKESRHGSRGDSDKHRKYSDRGDSDKHRKYSDGGNRDRKHSDRGDRDRKHSDRGDRDRKHSDRGDRDRKHSDQRNPNQNRTHSERRGSDMPRRQSDQKPRHNDSPRRPSRY